VTNEAVCLSLLHMDNEPLRIFPKGTRIPFGRTHPIYRHDRTSPQIDKNALNHLLDLQVCRRV